MKYKYVAGALLAVAVAGGVGFIATNQIPSEKNPYHFQYEREGVRYYLVCDGLRCTLVPESEVPERFHSN